jgi:hypothetical protein
MNWFLCGLVFTAFVALSVYTVALKASNVRCRRQIEQTLDQAKVRAIEREQLVHRMRQAKGREKLAECLSRHLERAEGKAQ